MLTYPNRRTTNIGPVDFDYKALGQATNLLLGKAKADVLLKDTSPKGVLKLIGELEAEAKNVRRDPKKEFPKDTTYRRSKEELENLREQMVRDIYTWRTLWSKQSLLNSLPYRLRSQNQLKALTSNEIEQIGREGENGPEITARVSIDSLPELVKQAENSGYAKLSFEVPQKDIEFVKNKLKQGNITITLRDELQERPELKRIILGNQNYRAQRLAREKKTNPKTEILGIANSFSGSIVVLSNNSRVTNVVEKETPKGIQLEVELMFPEILSAFEKNGRDSGGLGVISDGRLKTHCSNAYGCNGRDFLSSIPEISESLKSNLNDATKIWFDKESVNQEEINNFIEEFSILSLCLRHEPTPVGRLEPYKSLVKSSADIAVGVSRDHASTFEAGPENSFSKEILEDTRINMPTSASVLAGEDWIDNLVNNELYQTYKTTRGQNYSQEIENTYGIKDAARKMELIERNFWRVPNQKFLLLDGGPKNITLASYYLSNEMEEEYELKKEEQEQELFNSKAENILVQVDRETKSKKQIIDKAEWIQEKNPIKISLPYNGNVLHRLTRYPNRSSGLSIKTTRAEKFDEEISLSSKDFRRIPAKPDGKNISIEDCLTNSALQELQKVRAQGTQEQLEEIKRISSLLEQWQSSLRRLSITGENPLDIKVYRWLESLSQNKDESKATSLAELTTMLGASVSQTGRLPYENDKGVEHFSMPARSNTIALKLLCGTGFKEIEGFELEEKYNTEVLREDAIANNPAKLWDTVIRWQNAENAHEMELNSKTPKLLVDLETIVTADNFNPTELVTHAIKAELSELPDFKAEYLQKIGIKDGLNSVPKEFRYYADIFCPIDSSPETTTIKGEETPIEDVITSLKEQGIDISLSKEEEGRVQNAPEAALTSWRQDIITIIENLNKVDAPTNKDAEIDLILSTEPSEPSEPSEPKEASDISSERTSNLSTSNSNKDEVDPFMESIALLHQEIPQSEEDLKDIIKSLITHNPQKVKVNTPEGTIELIRGSNNSWSTKSKSPQGPKAMELFNKAQEVIINNKPETLESTGKDIDLTYLEAKTEARRTRLFENIDQLPKVLSTLPKELAQCPRIKELCEPLNILATQIQEAKKASALGENLIRGWMGAPEEKENTWGWDQSILNPIGSIEYLCDKITGKKESQNSSMTLESQEASKTENKASYFTHTLIRDSEKIEAVERLRTNGSVVAGNFLIESLNNNLLAIKAQASNSLPELIGDLEKELTTLLEQSHSKEVKDFVCETSPIKRLLEDKTKYRILESKLREINKELSETKGTVRNISKDVSDGSKIETVEHDQIGKDILMGANYKQSTNYEVNPTCTEIKTNKLWATRWLNSELGKQNLEQRIHLNRWAKEAYDATACRPKTAIAFLEFCKHRNLLNIPQAVSSGKLKEDEKKAIFAALRGFKESLNNICVDPQKTKFQTQLLASYALSQYVNNAKESKIWNKELERDLEKINHSVSVSDMTLNAVFDKNLSGQNNSKQKNSVVSPFKKKKELISGIDLEADIESADPKTKLRTVFRAVSVLYKAIPTEKVSSKRQKQKPPAISKSNPKNQKNKKDDQLPQLPQLTVG